MCGRGVNWLGIWLEIGLGCVGSELIRELWRGRVWISIACISMACDQGHDMSPAISVVCSFMAIFL